MHTIQWRITAESTPEIPRHCSHCGRTMPHLSSGLFRANANHHLLDVWLVHRCAACGGTWNMTVQRRVAPRSLPPALLDAYHENDAQEAWRCAHDAALHALNHVTPNYDRVPLLIDGPDILLDAMTEPVAIHMVCAHGLRVRVAGIIRQKLSLSSGAYARLLQAGRIAGEGDLKKARFVQGMVVIVYP